MSNFAITGVSGYIGKLLAKRLEGYGDCKKIVGIDIRNPDFTFQKMLFYNADVRDRSVGDIFEKEKIDTLVHLAFIFTPIRDMKKSYDININGTSNILKNAAKRKIKRIMIFSSTVAYGAHRDNAQFLTEESPIRGNNDFFYTRDKAEVEIITDKFRNEYKDIIIMNVRPSIIFGPNVDNHISRYIDRPVVPFISGYNPDFQFVHENDLIDACMLFFDKNVSGSFNIVGRDPLPVKSIPALGGRKIIDIPFGVFYLMNELMWQMRIPLVEMPASMSSIIMYRWIASGEKAKRELGFVPKYSTADAVLDFYNKRVSPK